VLMMERVTNNLLVIKIEVRNDQKIYLINKLSNFRLIIICGFLRG